MITIYRVTNPTDTINNVSSSNKQEFNNNKNTKVANAFITSYRIGSVEAVGKNQAVQQEIGDIQPLGKIEKNYTLVGYISKRDDSNGFNPIVSKLKTWDEEAKTNTNFPQGRFGIRIDDFRDYDIIPVGTGTNQTGLIWQNLQWDNDFLTTPLIAKFTITLTVSRGDGS